MTAPLVRFAPRPLRWSEHALDRLRERHPALANTLVATVVLSDAVCESWEPGDLDGLGQGVYVERCSGLRVAVDGAGTVRTVLP